MTVLHVLDHSVPLVSGYSIRSRNIVAYQHEMGLRPVVVTSPKHGFAGAAPESIDGIRYYRTPEPGGRLRARAYVREIALMLGLARRVAEVARAEDARVLHAHSPLLNGLPALWVGRQLGLPVVYEARAFWEDAAVDQGRTHEGSFRYGLTRGLETLLFRRAARVVAIGQAMREEIIRRGVNPGRVSVVPNGVDVAWFRPTARSESLAHRLGLQQGGPVLGFIGSFYHYEGLQFLLEALPGLREGAPGLRLLLVGSGEEEAVLRTKAASLGDAVVFAGQVPHDRVRDFYSLIDVFVYPRRRMRLTELVTPLKPLEAMAMARPVLASDVGGLTELITHEVTGLLFPAESRGRFAGEAVRLAADPGLRAELGCRARLAMIEERGWRCLVSRYLPLYEALVGGAP